MLVFNPKYQIDVFADWLDHESVEIKSTGDIALALQQEIKIAALPYMFDDLDEFKTNPFDYKQFDLLLISDVEFNHIKHVEQWLKEKDIKNYCFALGGVENYQVPANFIYRPWWMFNFINKNTFVDTSNHKPHIFDVLLGAKKSHRDFVMAKMQTTGLHSSSIVNYREIFESPEFYDEKIQSYIKSLLNGDKLWYPYVSPNMNSSWEVKEKLSRGISSIAPWEIYKNTRYSIVAETLHQRSFFLTEKTTKAMFAKRLFVLFSSKHFLKKLRSLGFQTFNNIIDESYDEIDDDVTRFEMAFDQVEQLARLDYNNVLEKTQTAREHNYLRLFEYREEIKSQMKTMVYSKLGEIKNVNNLQ